MKLNPIAGTGRWGFLLPLEMVLTDTHTHFYYEQDASMRDAMMQRCSDNGITRLFLPNVDEASMAMIDELIAAYPENCFGMAGLHPCEVKEDFHTVLEKIYKGMTARKIYAIGEIGIDLYWDKGSFSWQREAFALQIHWARKLDLPFVIHCREAFDEVFEVLEAERHSGMRGIFHCFTGTQAQAERAVGLNFHLGIGGVVTYKNAGVAEAIAGIPLSKIVLETDAPYLSPVPFRGKPNESAHLLYIAKKVAEVYGLPLEEIAAVTTQNSKDIFSI